MKKLLATTVVLATGLITAMPALADRDEEMEFQSERSFSLAVYGDAPYGCKAPTSAAAADECPAGSTFLPDSPNGPNPGDTRQIAATPAFIAAINRDPRVELVVHSGLQSDRLQSVDAIQRSAGLYPR